MTKKKDELPQTNPNKLSAMDRRRQRQENRGSGAIADWDSVIPELLRGLVAVVAMHKGTITFGYTRDGGAYYVNYYVDDESVKEYIRPTEDIDEWLQIEIESWKF